MLPNQSSNFHPGPNGQHRRQDSTSTEFDNLKISIPPRQAMHHRGQSYDQMMHCHGLLIPPQEDHMTDTNPQHMQHAIPETQPRPMARPGQRRNNSENGTLRPANFAPDPTLGTGCLKNDLSLAQINDMTDAEILTFLSRRKEQNKTNHSLYSMSAGSLDGNGYESNAFAGTMRHNSTNTFEAPVNVKTLRHDTEQYLARGLQRPCTPPAQSNYCPFPMTPDPTPHKVIKVERNSRTMSPAASPGSKDQEQTIKAPQPKRKSCKTFFGDQQVFNEPSNIPSPPASASLDPPSSFAMPDFPPSAFLDLSNVGVDFAPVNYTSSHGSPMSSTVSPTMSSFQSSPKTADLPSIGLRDQNMADFNLFSETSLLNSQSTVDLAAYSPRRQKPTHSRAQSASGIDSGFTTVDTGISSEEVNAFISGPNDDQKWTCMYPECGKHFGRKENIKSHVQTHLGDRQFLCIHCNKRFVRQHDLKRHEKIHTGVKPYPCECGHSFARMDALTRHKQRNTCIGGIGGPEAVEKKEIKRGRPRKHRPDTEERLNKASRTRQRVLEKKTASSVSGSSVCSFSSPPPMPECYDTDASAALPSPPHIFVHHDEYASAAMSRETSSSHYGTPPELDLSSSSPIASRFFDFEDITEASTNNASSGSDQMNNELASSLVLTQAEPDMDEMLLEFTRQTEPLSNENKDNDNEKQQAYLNQGDFVFLDDDPFGLGQDFASKLEDLTKLENLSWRMGNLGEP